MINRKKDIKVGGERSQMNRKKDKWEHWEERLAEEEEENKYKDNKFKQLQVRLKRVKERK